MNKICGGKKVSLDEVKNFMMKKVIVGKDGVKFIDQEGIDEGNKKIEERLNNMKTESKIRLKEIQELTKWIDEI